MYFAIRVSRGQYTRRSREKRGKGDFMKYYRVLIIRRERGPGGLGGTRILVLNFRGHKNSIRGWEGGSEVNGMSTYNLHTNT